MFFLIVFLFSFFSLIYYLYGRRKKSFQEQSTQRLQAIKLYDQAFSEFDNGEPDSDIWAKAYAGCDDEDDRKRLYIKLRVSDLTRKEQQKHAREIDERRTIEEEERRAREMQKRRASEEEKRRYREEEERPAREEEERRAREMKKRRARGDHSRESFLLDAFKLGLISSVLIVFFLLFCN